MPSPTTVSLFLFCAAVPLAAAAQTPDVTPGSLSDRAQWARTIPALAKQALPAFADPDRRRYLGRLIQLQLAAGEYRAAVDTIRTRRRTPAASGAPAPPAMADEEYLLYAQAKLAEAERGIPFAEAYRQAFRGVFSALDDRDANRVAGAVTFPAADADDVQSVVDRFKTAATLSAAQIAEIAAVYEPYHIGEETAPLVRRLVRDDTARRYIIRDDVVIKTRDGASLSAVVVRKRGVTQRLPAAFVFTIYADPVQIPRRLQYAAARGYVGVAAFTRGKARSTNRIVPYEYDGRDANAVIDWITRQPWSNGKVGMYGGSYNGFTAWAAAKWHNPALKTIVPWAANNPGNGLPMENNIFLLVNYPWAFYVTDNKYLDDAAYADPRSRTLAQRWYASGRPYRDVDAVGGRPNPWLHRWLAHPSFDAYWQSMVPYRRDFARIAIPVLTVTGYYDDGQGSALNFLKDHTAYNPRAEHYLVIGPYDHIGAQLTVKDAVLRGYAIDPAAQLDTPALTFAWLDYVLRGGKKPAILRDKINYEVMGANAWRHAPSLAAMSDSRLKLYLTPRTADGNRYRLSPQAPAEGDVLAQTTDFADRKTQQNDYYPFPIVGKKPNFTNALLFVSDPFTAPASVSGAFSGKLRAVINKRDLDIGVVLYELMPDGKLFQLSYFMGRASYQADPAVRRLLRPGVPQTISFDQTRVVSRLLRPGSRLLVALNVNKNRLAQINYGTGRDVSLEDIRDAKIPLRVRWLSGSAITVPISAPTGRARSARRDAHGAGV